MISWLRKLIQSGDQVSVSPKKIIVGLGNPGLRYVRTLHNAGFLTVDRIAGEDVKWKKWRNLASICIIEVEGVRVFLVKPSTYMNLSGKAVQPLLRQMGLLPQDLLVIHDDMDLPAGKIRLRPGGGSGGHKGIQSIIDHIQSRNFARLRIGVERPPIGVDPAEYVLQSIPYEKRPLFDDLWKRAGDAARCWAAQGIETAMNRYN
ncbi:MAG: aminoacyl-tRNA hydrolase [Syntrophaceticus sp.]|jgi:PTH1 family peptidyl-tRNA hydrolase